MTCRHLALGLGLSACLAAPAGAIDTNKPLLCAITEAVECPDEDECEHIRPGDMNLPPFLRIDVKGKKVSEYKGERSTTVKTVNERDDHVYLQGFENRAFSISISRESGRLTATASGPEVGFVLFGVCTEL